MKTLYPNRSGITGRIILLPLLFASQYFLVKLITSSTDTKGILLLYLITIVLALSCIALILSLLGVVKVEACDSPKQFIFYRAFSKQVLPASAIAGYYSTVQTTRSGTFYGRILKTSENKIITLNPGNLADIYELDDYLNELNITYLGQKMSFYPFTSGL